MESNGPSIVTQIAVFPKGDGFVAAAVGEGLLSGQGRSIDEAVGSLIMANKNRFLLFDIRISPNGRLKMYELEAREFVDKALTKCKQLRSAPPPKFPFWLLCKVIWMTVRGREIRSVQLHPPYRISTV